MKTPEQFVQSLRELNPIVYLKGEKIKSVADEPMLAPGVNAISLTYEYSQNAEYKDIMVATSHITEKTVSRLLHINTNTEDLLKKLEMTRLLCRTTGCAQRYLCHDALNALYENTHLVDSNTDSSYHTKFLDYLEYLQDEDLTTCVAMTDAKGDRTKRPHEQSNPDLYLRIVKKNKKGITVRGIKAIVTGAPYTHEIIVLPCRTMTEKDSDYAVSFAVPIDTKGVEMVSREAGRPQQSSAELSSKYGQATAQILFDDVFVPWERVFLAGEYEYAGLLTESFATHHRVSCIGARAGLGDMLIGASTTMAESNGLNPNKVGHIRQSITELIKYVESFYACGVTSSVFGKETPAGNFSPDPVYANIGKLLQGTHIYDMYKVAHEVSGGILVASPSPEDMEIPHIGKKLSSYLTANDSIPSEKRLKMARLLEDITASYQGGWYSIIGIHGGGSPEAQRIEMMRKYDFDERKSLAAKITGLNS
ncbi:MAG: 4-hydroxyphenylacetate 3-hydroxylase [Candidatus Dadabacteria bacterium]|nr:4-hydroxyphenylacetate 3-hydroxylase [Candidatus Dadabacteria bacterium]NIS10004.1 4-hydroxyphenylacetate 3-hydroxylase [Candidatus Dadabacteria bacterium]NIV43258.1 4-hydroxyphenylacetate 3-hydroxylase [Candidatus Dadabacteria bacterium]NIX16385.1 4-hydroxyphenylacetate 3-hydroxylase [Candidatus Dadabacteria bacterium]NIY22975.1 4-hydroxyphenylacetate 3-hydroxylase [Candidatus Dadabacteria bacterium]